MNRRLSVVLTPGSCFGAMMRVVDYVDTLVDEPCVWRLVKSSLHGKNLKFMSQPIDLHPSAMMSLAELSKRENISIIVLSP